MRLTILVSVFAVTITAITLLVKESVAEPLTLRQADFEAGTVRLSREGTYVLQEDIVFEPNRYNDMWPDCGSTAWNTSQKVVEGRWRGRWRGRRGNFPRGRGVSADLFFVLLLLLLFTHQDYCDGILQSKPAFRLGFFAARLLHSSKGFMQTWSSPTGHSSRNRLKKH